MNKVIKEIEDTILDKVEDWWEIIDIEYDENAEYIQAIEMEAEDLGIFGRIVLPCASTNFHYLLQADNIDYLESWDDAVINTWYETPDELLEDLSSIKVHKMISECREEE